MINKVAVFNSKVEHIYFLGFQSDYYFEPRSFKV